MGKRTQGREDDLERREADVTAREAALAERSETAQAILDAADERDASADTRDAAADEREKDLDRAELLAPPDKLGYGGDWPERRNASLDRGHAKDDRTASHGDRIALTEGHVEDDEPGKA
jgi:uncharacterized protein (DUF3084 family)